MSKNAAKCYSDLSSLSRLSWYQAQHVQTFGADGTRNEWYVDINAVKLTRFVWTDIGTLP